VKVRGRPAADKKPLAPFLSFCQEKRPEVRKEHPGISFKEVGRILGEMWRHLRPAGRRPYVDQLKADWAVYYLTHPEEAKPKRTVRCKKRGRGKPNFKRNIDSVKTLKTGRWQPDIVKTHDGR
jgi:hypothetical protein